ncbi:SH2 domain-containing protein 1B isoform X1 [Microcebus murinus]|uniref:SH2 domain-containing protein 1B isoform X1 n=1 Tax=Microcebus murinus TaxID=30608 RepID=UPI000643E082|nr:SH2 domain-containing protein 1B isoform X1 [Microcebus murinus]XP_020141019.1 SH2 domain-containing protein 1B isoform X1 [Microcebus murinus]
MDLLCYHGPLSKRDCETLLLQEGVDGNFLLRDSESMPGVLCLCVSCSLYICLPWLNLIRSPRAREPSLGSQKSEHRAEWGRLNRGSGDTENIHHRFKNFVYTYRIFREKHGHYQIETVEGAPKQIFPNLKELISKFEKPGQGLVVHLIKPIKRTTPYMRWRRLKLELDGIYENSNVYTNVLP